MLTRKTQNRRLRRTQKPSAERFFNRQFLGLYNTGQEFSQGNSPCPGTGRQDFKNLSGSPLSSLPLLKKSIAITQENGYLGTGRFVLNKPKACVYIQKEEKMDEDRELILQLKKGKMKAFRKLVEKYKRPAFFIALGLVGNREDAYDLSQEAFIRVYASMGRFDPQHRFFSWFYAILSNLCKNHLRNREIRARYVRSAEDDTEMSNRLNPAPGPDALLERNERSVRLWQEISKLPVDFKEIIILKHFQGYSYKEISQMLNIPLGSVMSRLYYARKKLKDNLKDILT